MEQSRITFDGDALNNKIAEQQNKSNKLNVLTRSQAKLKDANDRVIRTRAEITEVSIELTKNRRALEALQHLVDTDEANLADLNADYRSDLKMMHQLEMDGVFLPPPPKEEESNG